MGASADIARRLEVAWDAGREAGRSTLRYFQQANYRVERKADRSPVTIADREAEQLLRDRVRAAFPDDAVLGEELGELPGDSGFRWIFDPIDGTKSFISGVPLFGTMIGVEYCGESVLGVVFFPGLDEGVYAAREQGAWWVRGGSPPQSARVSEGGCLSDAVFLTSEVGSFAQRGAAEVFQRLERASWITRTWGDCYGYLLVATGRAGVMVDPIMNVWDAAALLPILEEAGGVFTDWRGRRSIDSGEGIGTNRALLNEVLAITIDFVRPAS